MPRNGSGQYQAPPSSWNPPVNGQAATADDWAATLTDMENALSQSVSKDGQTPMTGPLRMGGQRIIQIGAPSGPGNALRWEQIVKGDDIPSASALTIPNEGSLFAVTGTTTITSLGASFAGRQVMLQFAAVLTITDSISLILPAGDITTKAGDILIFVNTEPGVWQLLSAAGSSSAGGFRNLLINGDGTFQRYGYLSGTPTTAANQYVIDRWRVVATGESLIFSTVAGVTTLNCPAGGLGQVIEGSSVEGGIYVASWQGTATLTINGTPISNGASFVLPAQTNVDVVFKSGTLIEAQVELGSVASPFDRRPRAIEEILCRRYLPSFDYTSKGWIITGAYISSNVVRAYCIPCVTPRVTPTGVRLLGSLSNLLALSSTGPGAPISSLTIGDATISLIEIQALATGPLTGANPGTVAGIYANTGTGSLLLTGCEL